MVAVSFNKQFRAPIVAGTKRQTLRRPRIRPIREGQTLHLYTGLRTQYVSPIGTATCLGYTRILLDLECGRVESVETGKAWTTLDELNAFAGIDGFADWRALMAFWAKTHPDVWQWEGVRIWWGETFKEPTA